jgi:hypothetical protein
MKLLFQFLYLSLALLFDGHVGAASRPASVGSRHMSFESSEKRLVEPERLPETTSVHRDQPVLAQSELAPHPATENPLDLDALGRLWTLFELLDKWDQEEKADEK